MPRLTQQRDSLNRIDRRLALTFGAIVGLLAFVVLVVGSYIFVRVLEEDRKQLLSFAGDTLGHSVEQVIDTGKHRLIELVSAFGRDDPNIAFICVVTPEGKILAHTETQKIGRYASAKGMDAALAALKTGQRQVRNRERNGVHITELILPIRQGYKGKIGRILKVGVKTDSELTMLMRAVLPIALLVSLLLTLAIPAIYLVSRRLGAPIKRQALELTGILEHAPLAILIQDSQGRHRRSSRVFDELFSHADWTRRFLEPLSKASHEEIQTQVAGQEKTLLSARFPIGKDSLGQSELTCLIASDITDLRATEEERDRLVTAVQSTAEHVLLAHPDGRVFYVNPAYEEATGFDIRGSRAQAPWVLLAGNETDAISRLKDAIANHRTWRSRINAQRQDGSTYTLDQVVSPILDEEGALKSVVALGRDVTRELDLERKLVAAGKLEAIGRLAGGIAHDFNNLLTVINGHASLLLSTPGLDFEVKEDVENIRTAGKKAADLTTKLLAFSRRQVLRLEPLDLESVLENMVPMLSRVLGGYIKLVHEPAQGLKKVRADQGQLEQVLMNLAINARDAMPQGGTLRIAAENTQLTPDSFTDREDVAPGDYVALSVSDTGMGMPKAIQDQVFEPFFTTKGPAEGTGLGLSTVHGIVKQSKGHIFLFSEEGVGTTFRIYLPAQKDEQPKQKVLSTISEEQTIAKGSETVLVVEDEDKVRNTIVRMLQAAGYKTMEAEHGEQALKVLEQSQRKPDIVLSDLVMPIMDGPALAKHLREHVPEQKIIFMSGYSATAVDLAEELGGAELIHKPPSIYKLTQVVRTALDKA